MSQLSLLAGAPQPEPLAPAVAQVKPEPAERVARLGWTLSPWTDDGAGLVRLWLPDGHNADPRVAACLQPDDASDRWTLIVFRPTGADGDRAAWWTGGAYGRLEPVQPDQHPAKGERRVRQADGTLMRVTEVAVPHSETLEDAQRRADASLAKMARRHGGRA